MKRIRGGVFILILALALGLAGCSKESFFGESSVTEPEVKIITLENGTILNPAAEIPISLSVSSEYQKKEVSEPYMLFASILTSEGVEVASVTIENVELRTGPLPPLLPPRLEGGTYNLVLTLKQGQTIVFQGKTTFFIEEGVFAVEKISMYPLSVPPVSTAIIQAILSVPSGSDPFIRWTIQGKVVQEKTLSEGGEELTWLSPEKGGVYPVRVDLFPRIPKEGETYTFSSEVSLTAQIFVSSSIGLQDTDLKPEEAHFSLFNFLGNLKDSGYRKNKLIYGTGNLRSIGTTNVMRKEGVFGYALDGYSGFFTAQSLLPVGGNALLPFTLRFRLRPETPVANRTWFEFVTKDRAFQLLIGTSDSGTPETRLSMGGVEEVMHSDSVLQEGITALVEFSLYSLENVLYGRWMVNGVTEPLHRFSMEIPTVGEEGSTWIGLGEEGGGFIGILDEFGIRTDASQGTIQEGSIPVQVWEAVEIGGSEYMLPPGSDLVWGPIPFVDTLQKVTLVSDFPTVEGGEVWIQSSDLESNPWITIATRNNKLTLITEDKTYNLPEHPGEAFEFLISRENGSVVVACNTVQVIIPLKEIDPTSFSVGIRNRNSEAQPVQCHAIKVEEQSGSLDAATIRKDSF